MGSATFDSTLTVAGLTNLNGNLAVGVTSLNGGANVTGDLYVNGTEIVELIANSSAVSSDDNFNTSGGTSSLASNTNGSYNSAFGYQSLANNTDGTNNSAFGSESLMSNTTGMGNTALVPKLYSTIQLVLTILLLWINGL